MRGHAQLIAMRRKGFRPAAVWITTDLDAMRCWRDWHEIRPAHAQIEVERNDQPALLDLRSLIGLQVTVTGSDAARDVRNGRRWPAERRDRGRAVSGVLLGDAQRDSWSRYQPLRGDGSWPASSARI